MTEIQAREASEILKKLNELRKYHDLISKDQGFCFVMKNPRNNFVDEVKIPTIYNNKLLDVVREIIKDLNTQLKEL